MSYQVIWDQEASDQVQRIHDAALDRQAVLHAVTRVGLELSAVPLEAGESRDPGTRILFKYPLIVWYRVDNRLRDVVNFRVHDSWR